MSIRPLTVLEIECLRWSMEAKAPGEIAVIMHLAEDDIRAALHSAMDKLQCPTKYQAVLAAIRLGLLA